MQYEKQFRTVKMKWKNIYKMSILLKALYTEVHKYILDCNDSLDKVNNYLVDPIFPKQIPMIYTNPMQLLRLHFKECLSSWLVRLPELICGIYLHILESRISVPSNIDVRVANVVADHDKLLTHWRYM